MNKNKKTTKQQKRKVKKQKKPDRRVRKEIKKAIDELPNFFVEQIKFKANKNPVDEKMPDYNYTIPKYDEYPASEIARYEKEQKKKRMVMWSAVIILVAIIFTMWIWNTKILFQSINNPPKNNLFKEAKQNLKSIMQSTAGKNLQASKSAENKGNQNTKESLKQGLAKILNSLNPTTTVSSTR